MLFERGVIGGFGHIVVYILQYNRTNQAKKPIPPFYLVHPEMMMVVTVIIILASISTPFYRTAVIRAREAVLRDHLYTLRNLIDEFTRDHARAPSSDHSPLRWGGGARRRRAGEGAIRGTNPSPVLRRLEKAPSQSTLSPGRGLSARS